MTGKKLKNNLLSFEKKVGKETLNLFTQAFRGKKVSFHA